MRPGVNVGTLERATPSQIPTDVSLGLMVGITESGPDTPTTSDEVRNMDEYESVYAPSGRDYLPGQMMYDSADEFFNQGGASLGVGRVVGDGALPATGDIVDAAAGVVLEVAAKGNGEWGNNLDVRIDTHAENSDIGTTSYRINVLKHGDTSGIPLEASPDISSTDGAITWSHDSMYLSIEGGTSTQLPKSATVQLAGGTNDVASIDNTNWQGGLDTLGSNLGPGILMLPGVTTDALHQAAALHAMNFDRVAFLDGPDTAAAATLIAAAKAVTDSAGRSRFSGLFAPWLITPGIASGTVRKVPPSPAVAGLFARNMANGLSPNEPAAGDNGILRNVLDFTQVYSDADRQTMNGQGVNVLRDVYGTPKVYGWRTTADPVNDKNWIGLNNSILHRQIVALCNAVGERFIFRQIDGNKRLTGQFGTALSGSVLKPLFDNGALFGDTPADAYNVDTGDNVNTPTTIQNNELHAVLSVHMAGMAEEVDIQIVKYLLTEAIPA